MGLFDRLKNIGGQQGAHPPERYANPTEAEADSAMNANLAHVTSRWNRGSLGNDTAVNPMSQAVGKAVDAVKNVAAGTPENTPEWKAQQAQIDEKRSEVQGSRYMKRLRGGR